MEINYVRTIPIYKAHATQNLYDVFLVGVCVFSPYLSQHRMPNDLKKKTKSVSEEKSDSEDEKEPPRGPQSGSSR